MRPTPRLALLLGVAIPVSVLIGGVAPALWTLPFALTAIILAAFALDFTLTLAPSRLRTTLTLPPQTYIGASIPATATFQIASRGVLHLELLPETTGEIAAPVAILARLAPNTINSVRVSLTPTRRGRVSVTSLLLRWYGPLGLNQRLVAIPTSQSTDVLPDIRAVQAGALQFYDRDSPAGLKMQRDRGAGTEFDNLREFMAGMDVSSVDWKHSARHGKLVAREMRVERNHHIVLAYDTGLLMRAPIAGVPRLDHAIGAGLLLGWIALRGGDSVATYAFDSRVRQWAPPIRGTSAFSRLQHQAASLAYHSEETNFTLGLAELQARLKRRALVVLFTDFTDTTTAELMAESLAALHARHVVVFVSLRDPELQSLIDAEPLQADTLGQAVIASDFLRERRIVFARLQRMGIHCLDVDRSAINTNLINRYVSIKQRGLL